jgi:hypothetical protein
MAAGALVPVPFTSAGFTLPPGPLASSLPTVEDQAPIPLEAPVTVVIEQALCAKTGGGPFPIPTGLVCSDAEITTTSLANGEIAISTPLYQFTATVASVPGDRWSVELVNPVLALPGGAVVGDTFATPKLVSLRIAIDAFPSARFTVPDATEAPVESIAFRRIPPNVDSTSGLPLLEARSGELDTAARPFTPGLFETFLDGDVVTLAGRASYLLTFQATVFVGSVTSVHFTHQDPCGSAAGLAALPQRDCKAGLELHAVHAATPTASLACRADLDGNGVVNFVDLAQFRSVFLQRCEP